MFINTFDLKVHNILPRVITLILLISFTVFLTTLLTFQHNKDMVSLEMKSFQSTHQLSCHFILAMKSAAISQAD